MAPLEKFLSNNLYLHGIIFLFQALILIGTKLIPGTHSSHPHTPAPYGHPSPTPYGPTTPAPHYGALGYRPPSYGYTPRPIPYAPPRPHYPASVAPSYGAHPHSHGHAEKPHGSDYGPPSCVKNATLHTYCLEDYEYPSQEIQVRY